MHWTTPPQQTTPHPEAPQGDGWMHVALKQSPPPPPIIIPPPRLRPWLFVVGVLLGWGIAMGFRDWQLIQANQRADQATSQRQALEREKAAYCQGGAVK